MEVVGGDINIQDFGDLEVYYDDTNGMFEITDGTNTSTVSVNIVRDTGYYLAYKINAGADSGSGDLNIGYSTDLSSWTMDESDNDFDSGLTISNTMIWCEDCAAPFEVTKTYFSRNVKDGTDYLSGIYNKEGGSSKTIYSASGGNIIIE